MPAAKEGYMEISASEAREGTMHTRPRRRDLLEEGHRVRNSGVLRDHRGLASEYQVQYDVLS